ncbi:hypothetical protein [Kallotenue papyrolyticum]|uniref:hypothetical protein n=1 Tax=Kallotenue papyrolyticum TaxID=1325125 RepID=UPI0004929BBD|nr:hypothetical protein [Kallotenue papyrolyticum]
MHQVTNLELLEIVAALTLSPVAGDNLWRGEYRGYSFSVLRVGTQYLPSVCLFDDVEALVANDLYHTLLAAVVWIADMMWWADGVRGGVYG